MEGTMFSSSLILRGSSYFMVNRILAFFWKDAVNLSDPPPQANIVITVNNNNRDFYSFPFSSRISFLMLLPVVLLLFLSFSLSFFKKDFY